MDGSPRRIGAQASVLTLMMVLLGAMFVVVSPPAGAAPIALDFTSFSKQGVSNAATWTVALGGLQAKEFSSSHKPTFFVSPQTYRDASFTGTIRFVGADDDMGGWVLGHKQPNPSSGATDYDTVIIDWKHTAQTHIGHAAPEGVTAYRIVGSVPDTDAARFACFWAKNDAACPADITVLDQFIGGGTGWRHNTNYQFRIDHEADHVQVYLEGGSGPYATGEVVVDFSSPVIDKGRFGLFAFSQDHVIWESPQLVDTTDPEASIETTCDVMGNNGWCIDTLRVRGRATDDGSGVSVQTCTLDGSGTTCDFQTITGDGTHTFTVSAQDAAGNTDSASRNDLKFDGTAPTLSVSTSCTQPGSNGWCQAGLTGSASASDATSGFAGMSCTLDGSASGCSSVPITSPGSHTFAATASDHAGHTSAGSATAKLDGTAPGTAIALTGTLGTNNFWQTTVDVALSCSDATSGCASTTYKLDGGPDTAYTGPFTVSGDGTHSVEYWSVDAAGNTESAKTKVLKLDTTDPVTTSTIQGVLGDNDWWLTNVEVKLQCTDATSGCAVTEYQLDGGATTTYTAGFPVTGDGIHNVKSWSTDNAGNQEPDPQITIKIDTTKPVLSSAALCGTMGNAGWCVSDVELKASSVDATSGVDTTTCLLDDAPHACGPPFFVAADGAHTWKVTADDNAGNVAPTITKSFKIDQTDPVTSSTLTGTTGTDDWWRSDVSVALSCFDATSGCSSTHYRVNGGPLTTYAGAFLITADGTHTVTYHSVDVAGNTEGTTTITIKKDATKPMTTVMLSGSLGSNGWWVSDVSVTLTCNDATSGCDYSAYRINAGPSTTYVGTFLVSAPGHNTVDYFSGDNAGNLESDQSVTIKIDDTAPVLSLSAVCTTPGNAGWCLDTVTTEATATDAVSGVASLGCEFDGAGTPCAATARSADGTHTFAAEAKDAAGNSKGGSTSFMIDSTDPVTGATLTGTLGTNDWYRSAVTVGLSCSDAMSGCSDILYAVDGGAFQSYAGAFSIGTDGQHSVAFYGVDIAGNQEPTQTVSFQVDRTRPTTSSALAGTIGGDGWYLTDVDVSLSCSDATSGCARIEYRLDGAAFTTYTGTFTVAPDGDHNVRHRAVDNAGNTGSNRRVDFRIDQTDPVPAIAASCDAPGLADWCAGGYSLEGSATDAHSGVGVLSCRLDGDPVACGPFVVTQGGLHIFEVDVTDVAGNSASTSHSFKVDNIGPSTDHALSGTFGNGGFWRSDVHITLSCSDDQSGCTSTKYRVSGGVWQTYTGTFTIGGEGDYTIDAYSVDAAGNVGETDTFSFVIDQTAPTTGISLGGTMGSNGWFRGPVTVTMTCSDPTPASGCFHTTFELDGGATQTYAGPFVVSPDGMHNVNARSEDVAGNVETVQSAAFKIDQTRPDVSVSAVCLTPGGGGWCLDEVTTQASASDATSGLDTLTCRINGVVTTCDPQAHAGQGNHAFRGTAVDVAGNTRSSTVHFKIDSIAPETAHALTGPLGGGGFYLGPVTVDLSCSDPAPGSGCAVTSYSVDGGAAMTYTGPFVVTGDGPHTVTYHSVDVAGNVEADESFDLSIDTTPPVSTIVLTGTLGDDGWYVSPVQVSLFCADPEPGSGCAETLFSLNDGTQQAYSGPFTVSVDRNSHKVVFRSDDVAGNVEDDVTQRFKIDTTAPVPTIHYQCDIAGLGGWCIDTITMWATATDNLSGVAALECALDGAPITCAKSKITEDGVYLFRADVRDVAGNTADTQRTLYHDGTGPEIDITIVCTAPGLDGWCRSSVSADSTVSDPLSGVDRVTCYLNGVVAACNGLVVHKTGWYTFTVVAFDRAGNRNIEAGLFKIDKIAPEVSIDPVCTPYWNGVWCTDTATVRPVALDRHSGLASVTCTLDGAPVTCGRITVDTEGWHTYGVVVKDVAGNQASASHSFGVDQTAPTLSVTNPEEGCSYLFNAAFACGGLVTSAFGDLDIEAAATDAGSGFSRIEIRIDGHLRATLFESPATWTWEVNDENAGTHSVSVRAFDVAGNSASFSLDVAGGL